MAAVMPAAGQEKKIHAEKQIKKKAGVFQKAPAHTGGGNIEKR